MTAIPDVAITCLGPRHRPQNDTRPARQDSCVAFERFATDRLPALLRQAMRLTGNREMAEDLVQDVLVKVYRCWSKIEQADDPDRYVTRMIMNEFLSGKRRRAVRTTPLMSDTLGGLPVPDAPDFATTHAERNELFQRLYRLPRQQRAVVVLRFYNGFSDIEIAEILHCSPGTVRGYASRALDALRKQPEHSAVRTGKGQR